MSFLPPPSFVAPYIPSLRTFSFLIGIPLSLTTFCLLASSCFATPVSLFSTLTLLNFCTSLLIHFISSVASFLWILTVLLYSLCHFLRTRSRYTTTLPFVTGGPHSTLWCQSPPRSTKLRCYMKWSSSCGSILGSACSPVALHGTKAGQKYTTPLLLISGKIKESIIEKFCTKRSRRLFLAFGVRDKERDSNSSMSVQNFKFPRLEGTEVLGSYTIGHSKIFSVI